MNFFPDDRKDPSGGERVTNAAGDAIRLAHRALDRFPHVVKRHKFIAGGAAISSSLVALAGVAIARRLRSGQSEEEALASITEEELNGLRIEFGSDLEELEPPEASTNGVHPEAEEEAEAEPAAVSEYDATEADSETAAQADEHVRAERAG